MPGARSTPDETSTTVAFVVRIAVARLPTFNPPDSIQGLGQLRPAISDQSKLMALPPGSAIRILSTRGDWSYAALPNDLRGWIPAQNAERVRL